MSYFRFRRLVLLASCFLFTISIFAQSVEPFVYGDLLPDAPELSARGEYKIGVRTLDFTNKNQIDVLKSKGGIDPVYDRKLKVEIWYPAALATNDLIKYDEVMGTFGDAKRPLIPFTFLGRANRDAPIKTDAGTFPLVIVSHGYVGSRFLMTYLTENLASKGYIAVAIDHTDATFRDAGGFPSTLLNRSKDVLYILNEMAELAKPKSKSFLAGFLDVENTGLIGYSMGGYGVLNVAGAGYSEAGSKLFTQFSGGSKALDVRTSANETYKKSIDPRVKVVVAFAPWGMERSFWDTESMKGLKTPTLFIAGSQDDISGYEKGIKAIYKGVVNADRYLLTYMNARHNIAPNPPPPESLKPGLHIDEYYRYAEPAWNEKRINNINQHFVTAFLGIHLKKKDFAKYLDVKENSNEKTWTGFKPRSSTGLELLHSTSGN